MKCTHKTSLNRRIAAIIRGNKGASIVLVTIIAILVITAVIILRSTTGALWATADKQVNYDQAYEMATSLGDSLDILIVKEKKINLSDIYNSNGIIVPETQAADLTNSSVIATVSMDSDGAYVVTVESHVASASYIYTAKYRGGGTRYTRKY